MEDQSDDVEAVHADRRYKRDIRYAKYRVKGVTVNWLILVAALAAALVALIYFCVKFQQFCRKAGEEGRKMLRAGPGYQGVSAQFGKSEKMAQGYNTSRMSDGLVWKLTTRSTAGRTPTRTLDYWKHRLGGGRFKNASLMERFADFCARHDNGGANAANKPTPKTSV